VSIDVALLCAEYVFGTHEVHSAEPIVSLYFPAGHDKQGGAGIGTNPAGCNSAKSM
jgi:hypothetical protein